MSAYLGGLGYRLQPIMSTCNHIQVRLPCSNEDMISPSSLSSLFHRLLSVDDNDNGCFILGGRRAGGSRNGFDDEEGSETAAVDHPRPT
jgi:hypothetical protein